MVVYEFFNVGIKRQGEVALRYERSPLRFEFFDCDAHNFVKAIIILNETKDCVKIPFSYDKLN